MWNRSSEKREPPWSEKFETSIGEIVPPPPTWEIVIFHGNQATAKWLEQTQTEYSKLWIFCRPCVRFFSMVLLLLSVKEVLVDEDHIWGAEWVKAVSGASHGENAAVAGLLPGWPAQPHQAHLHLLQPHPLTHPQLQQSGLGLLLHLHLAPPRPLPVVQQSLGEV